MGQEKNGSITRRSFVSTSGLGLAGVALAASTGSSAVAAEKLRVAIVGTGSRGSGTWGRRVIESHGDVVDIVGLCDINPKRAKVAQGIIGTSAPTFVDFDQMLKATSPEAVIVTTVDSTHYRYAVRAMELGCDVITEKPMCTDAEQCQAILDAQAKTGRKVTVTFNARHGRVAKKVKQLLLENSIGEIVSVDFHEYLNQSHGADYFRRWHRLKENSGTLLVHKASHHFDQANWWLDSDPVDVMADGELRFYGRNHAFRSTNCRGCPYKDRCELYWDITQNERYMKLYVECEDEDGYFRDGCLWRENTNIHDTMSVLVRYANNVRLTYTANCYLPYEGQAIYFNGKKGRLDAVTYSGGGQRIQEIRLTRGKGETEIITDFGPVRSGGHGGSDISLKDMVFKGTGDDEGLSLSAGTRAGALSSLIGVAAYTSIDRGGEKIRISDLVEIA